MGVYAGLHPELTLYLLLKVAHTLLQEVEYMKIYTIVPEITGRTENYIP